MFYVKHLGVFLRFGMAKHATPNSNLFSFVLTFAQVREENHLANRTSVGQKHD